MKKYFLKGVLFLLSFQVYATDLMDIYKQALENDPAFKAAYSTYMSSKEAIPQARAALYPQLTITASTGRNVEDVSVGQTIIIPGLTVVTQTYNNVTWQVNASQAVFNYQAWARVEQARASVKSAQATFNDAAQNLLLRTCTAYLNILFAKDTLEFAEAKKRANKRQYDQAEQRFKVGVDTITSVYEAKAAYNQSIAEVISAKNNQINQNENLRKITNYVYDTISPLRDKRIPLIRPEPNNADEWVNTSIYQNYKLHAAKFDLESARDNIKVKAAGNWPTFAIEGNGGQILNSDVGNGSFFVPSRQGSANIAIAMNFPVMQGGLIVSQTRQAQYDYQTYSEKFETVYRDITVNSRIAFNTIIDGISKVKADRQTLISQQNSLESTEVQYQAGTRTMVDVVNAQRRLFEAQTQLADDQYNLIKALLNLKYFAGSLNVNDLEEVNSWLATTRINRFAKPIP